MPGPRRVPAVSEWRSLSGANLRYGRDAIQCGFVAGRESADEPDVRVLGLAPGAAPTSTVDAVVADDTPRERRSLTCGRFCNCFSISAVHAIPSGVPGPGAGGRSRGLMSARSVGGYSDPATYAPAPTRVTSSAVTRPERAPDACGGGVLLNDLRGEATSVLGGGVALAAAVATKGRFD